MTRSGVLYQQGQWYETMEYNFIGLLNHVHPESSIIITNVWVARQDYAQITLGQNST